MIAAPRLPARLPLLRASAATGSDPFGHTAPPPRCAAAVGPAAGELRGIATMARELPPLAELRAVLFDVDGTLADSDPLHFLAFRECLQEVGFQDGVPIDEAFFQQRISGRANSEIGADLLPLWPREKRDKFLDDKEARFRSMAAQELRPVRGLQRLCNWAAARGLRAAAVTNAPRANAEQMIEAVGLSHYFEHLVIGSECARPKPYPEPYLEGLACLGEDARHAFALEDSPSGIRAAVAAGVAVVGVTTGNPEGMLRDAGASLIIADFDDALLWDYLTPPQATEDLTTQPRP
eukprot:SM000117S25488  [mRNA]  locus=s117:123004:124571:+ [translate_table: standard]